MSDDILTVVYKSAVLGSMNPQQINSDLKHFYAAASDFICTANMSQLVEDMKDRLLKNILRIGQHVLYDIIPDYKNHTYNVRPRRHTRNQKR